MLLSNFQLYTIVHIVSIPRIDAYIVPLLPICTVDSVGVLSVNLSSEGWISPRTHMATTAATRFHEMRLEWNSIADFTEYNVWLFQFIFVY